MMPLELNRREFVRELAALAALASAGAACTSTSVLTGPSPIPGPPGSKDGMVVSARARGLTFGCGVNGQTLLQSDLLAAHVRESGLVVPMGLGSWEATHPAPTTWDFTILDAMWQWARSVSLPMRGVHLLWHQGMPSWFASHVTPANAAQYMRDHIVALMGRYRGQFHSWNPVNEAIQPSDGRPDGLRNSPWVQLLGPQYIPMAFTLAAEADPSAVLVYNEFGIEDDSAASDLKRQRTLQLLASLLQQGAPVHALGMQAHIGVSYTFSQAKLTAFLDAVAALGLKVFITELDVKDQLAPAEIAQRDAAVAAKYHEFLQIVLAHPAVTAVMVWGLSDRITWLTRQAPRNDGLPVRPLPLDDQLQRKPAWTAIVDALGGR